MDQVNTNIEAVRELFRFMRAKAIERFTQEEARWLEVVRLHPELDMSNVDTDLIAMYDQYIDSKYVNEHSLMRVARNDQWEWTPTPQEYVQYLKDGQQHPVQWEHTTKYSAKGLTELTLDPEFTCNEEY